MTIEEYYEKDREQRDLDSEKIIGKWHKVPFRRRMKGFRFIGINRFDLPEENQRRFN